MCHEDKARLRFDVSYPSLTFCLSIVKPYLYLNSHENIIASRLNHIINIQSLPPKEISFGFAESYSSQTSRYFLGSSVITPSTPFLMLHLIHSSSLTVHTNKDRFAALVSAINLGPPGPTRIWRSRLKFILGRDRNCRAYPIENPIWVMGNSGR